MALDQLKEEIVRYSNPEGTSINTLIELSEPTRSLLQRCIQGPLSAEQISSVLGLGKQASLEILALLVDHGFLEASGQPVKFGLHLKKHQRPGNAKLPWNNLFDDDVPTNRQPAKRRRAGAGSGVVQRRRGR